MRLPVEPTRRDFFPVWDELSENLHQGFAAKNQGWNPSPNVVNSTTTLGLRASLFLEGFGQSHRARYYNPAIGRFISEDPMGFAGSGPDLYAYAGDDPIDFNDPTGLDKKDNCSKLRKQLTLGVQAAINSGLLAQKLAELPIYEAISGAAAPETGGASTLLGVYKFVQALGLAESTGGQWYGAVTGKFETAESMEQEGDIAANPIVGVPAYLLTNNPAFAQEAANTLGLVLATGDYVNSGFGRQSIAKGVDMLMNAASVFGTGCKE
jgi:uncharacterized protein RhaS with RHS repeats